MRIIWRSMLSPEARVTLLVNRYFDGLPDSLALAVVVVLASLAIVPPLFYGYFLFQRV
jgi:hypothetical protein